MRVLHKLKLAAANGGIVDGAADLFACEEGDPASDCAFEELPPADVLKSIQPVEVCPTCFPDYPRAA